MSLTWGDGHLKLYQWRFRVQLVSELTVCCNFLITIFCTNQLRSPVYFSHFIDQQRY